MAEFNVEGVDELMKELEQIDVEHIAPKMLEESVEILEGAVKRRTAKHKVTGDMLSSIKPTGAQRNNSGYYICVRPTGKDRKGVRNMEKMAYLEYGTSRQRARPVLSVAVNESEAEVLKKMQEVFERECRL